MNDLQGKLPNQSEGVTKDRGKRTNTGFNATKAVGILTNSSAKITNEARS
ncbi:hypothetical protein GCM10011391_08920 [Pullulanibacillus camelliae]|uniref:Uncharacterized protein n=1 Tax=Pullulanibacillus camelliae TaxID=1707096 RepID=A0A8J2YFY9_9BACL|nr:hypothetical protein [Pullulanibacillus camelliae]GGE32457.1 hypothetical protein GCM10011391_08920 [Pullulanibacillus camelliae]